MRLLIAGLACVSFLPVALAQTGVSDDRVSLPEGPGSLQGVGDNASINPNMGSMSYSVPIDIPAGFEGVTPSFTLAYSSSGSNGVLGYGWSMDVPFIERMTNWGLPEYDADDLFVADGGNQLVRTEPGDPATYRARFEGGFVRYRWYGAGDEGYWTGESPDGVVWYYGAEPDGTVVDSARFTGRQGTFRYHLVAAVDPFGHRAEYHYRAIDGLPYLDRVEYTFSAGNEPGSSVSFTYAPRQDYISDARSGSNERLTQRLTAVEVFSLDVRMWRYEIDYEPYADAGGQSRVQAVQRFGLENEPDPAFYTFEYSKALGGACEVDCESPFLVDMGSLGVSLGSGDATLIDINGDALPDVVDTSRDGAHRFFINRLDPAGAHAFDGPFESAIGNRAGHQLSSPYVQVLDANGDGRTDMVNVRTGVVLYNLGGGDWAEAEDVGTGSLPDFGDDFAVGDEELGHVRFLDYDMDKKIDVIQSREQVTQVWRNRGADGYALDPDVESIGAGFADSRLELADMNGDGLQDPVILSSGQLSWRMNLGWGRWSADRVIEDLPFNEGELEFVELEDINGDGMDDIVLVLGDRLRYALNRGGERFDTPITVDGARGQGLPVRADGTSVLYADMNGSGSDDVVWITADGDVTYLELFPLRPNLMTQITNGLGMVVRANYVTSAAQAAVAEQPWAYVVPFPMIMVASTDIYDEFNNVHQVTEYTYSDAYYDAEEKTFRGFERVETRLVGDAQQAAGLERLVYDVGADDRYHHGKLLRRAVYEDHDGTLIPLMTNETVLDECPVEGIVEAPPYPVRFICPVAELATRHEGLPEGEWVEIRSEMTYDGYGNVVEDANLGVVSVGGGACGQCDRPAGEYGAPCGATCDGDELFEWVEFVDPADNGDRWFLRKPIESRSSASADAAQQAETTYFYDGAAFSGLPRGQLTQGLVRRVAVRADADHEIQVERYDHDAHGNVITTLDPRAEPGAPGLRRTFIYDDEGLLVAEEATELLDPDGAAYSLRRSYEYDPIWGVLSSVEDESLVRGGEVVVPGTISHFTYDALGRLSSRSQPGDPEGRPTSEYIYRLGAPVSEVVTRQRTDLGARLADWEEVQCLDGFGRNYQSRRRVSGGQYEVGAFVQRNRRGLTVFEQLAYADEGAACALEAPDASGFRTYYDGAGRMVRRTYPDGPSFGSESEERVVRTPLSELTFEPLDNDPEAAEFDTPTLTTRDGLGRVVEIEQRLADDATETYHFNYDARGYLARITDPAGHERRQSWDAAGRLIETRDADRGTTRFTYDDASNLVERRDAAGRVVQTTYDALKRPLTRLDPADPDGTNTQWFYDDPTACFGDCGHTPGSLVRVEYPGGSDEYQRDQRARVTERRRTIDGVSFALTYEYDNLNRVVSAGMPDGTQLDYTFDGGGRVTSIAGVVDAADYLRADRVQRIDFANGVAESWTYDEMLRPVSMSVAGAGGEVLHDVLRQYDRAGVLRERVDQAVQDGVPGLSARYGYDAISRLTRVDLEPDRAPFAETLRFTYEAHRMQTRTSSRGVASPLHVGDLAYMADRPNVIRQAGAVQATHDAAGYLTRRGDVTLERDYLGLVIGARDGEDATQAIRYDSGDRRVVVDSPSALHYSIDKTFEVEDGIALTRVFMGNSHVATRESAAMAAQVLPDLVPDGTIDAADAVMAASEGAPTAILLRSSVRRALLRGQPRTEYRHTTVHELPVLTTGEDGAALDRPRLGPFGLARTSTPTRRAVHGRETLPLSGLVDYGSRYYDPWLGRFAAPDRLADQPSAGLATQLPWEVSGQYQFARNNPVLNDDAGGYWPDDDDGKGAGQGQGVDPQQHLINELKLPPVVAQNMNDAGFVGLAARDYVGLLIEGLQLDLEISIASSALAAAKVKANTKSLDTLVGTKDFLTGKVHPKHGKRAPFPAEKVRWKADVVTKTGDLNHLARKTQKLANRLGQVMKVLEFRLADRGADHGGLASTDAKTRQQLKDKNSKLARQKQQSAKPAKARKETAL